MSTSSQPGSSAPPLGSSVYVRLSTMMFLQYAIWGSWLLLLWPFLKIHRKFSEPEIGQMFAVGAVGAILAPWIAGQIADRWFNTEKFLAISHILGAVLIWQLATLETYWEFLVFSLLYSIVYTPTLSLTNSLAFHHIPDRDRDFGRVRVWGTVGWIVAGISVGQWLYHQHTIDEAAANRQLIERHILDKDGRGRLNQRVQVTVKKDSEKKETKLQGTVYETIDASEEDGGSILVINTGEGDRPELVAVRTKDIESQQPVLETNVRKELLPEVRDAMARLDDASADVETVSKSIAEQLAEHSNYTLFKTRGKDSELGKDAIVHLADGGEVTGELIAKTSKVYVLELPDQQELTVLRVEDVKDDRKKEGEPVVGTLLDENGEWVVVQTTSGVDTSIAKADLAGREHYGVFTDEAVQTQRSAVENAGKADAFRFSAILGMVMGVFCFLLPRTPPQPGKQRSAAMEAVGEIKKNPLITLFLLAVPISCIHQFYFVHTSGFVGIYQAQAAGLVEAINSVFGVGGVGLMTIGQMTELFVLALMPLVAKKVSRKGLLMTGIIAYALRMFLFAYVDQIPLPPIVTLILGISLHGFCFGCFIFVAFMIVDEETTGDVRASAQSLFNLVIVGVGIIVGSMIAGAVAQWATVDDKMNYTQLFSVPMWAAVACLAILLVFYPGGRKRPRPAETAVYK